MSSSTTRLVLKRGCAALFGSPSSRAALFGCGSSSSRAALFGCGSSSRAFSSLAKSNGKRDFLDTLAMVRRMEAQGVPSKHADVIISTITEVWNNSLEYVENIFVSKGEMQKSEMTRDASLSEFKSNLQSSLDHHFSLLQREIEKLQVWVPSCFVAFHQIRVDNEKMHIELRKEISESKSDILLEIHASRAQLEVTKFQVIKYCIATFVSILAAELALLRILM